MQAKPPRPDELVKSLHRDERGVALAVVLLVGVSLVLVTTVMMARGLRQFVRTASEIAWDDALFAAEAGLDDALALLDVDFTFTTGEQIPDGTIGTEAERVWAVIAADMRSASDVNRVAEGEYVMVRPSNADIVFAVGYSPSRAASNRRVRVVRLSVVGTVWTYTIEYALIVGEDLELAGSATINDINQNDGASVHTNGTVIETGGAATVEGCLTESVGDRAASATCPVSPLPQEPLAVIEPLLMYPYAHYVLCDDEVVYGGPVHATDPDPDATPCNGNETAVSLLGWSARVSGGVVEWSGSPSADADGVFYIDNGNFDGKLGDISNPLLATIIIASGGGSSCTAPSTGNLRLAGNSDFSVHPSIQALGWDVAVVAEGDIDYQGGAAIGGTIFAHEQIDYRGNADSWGAVVAVEACDTIGSPVSSSTVSGSSVINYPGPITTPFTASSLRVEVAGWYEL
jgi:hypothetical protein